MAGRLSTLLAGLVESPDRPIGELPRLSAGEASQALAGETAVGDAIAEVWRAVLGVERVGIDDGFFALGGGPRQLEQMLAALREAFRVALAGAGLGAEPTVAGLARAIAGELLAGADAAAPAEILTEMDSGGSPRPRGSGSTPSSGR
jgi:hypothetical protein